jgi:hypothetical protein
MPPWSRTAIVWAAILSCLAVPLRQGQHSIRLNDQYRICFRWTAAGPAEVEIVDYHWARLREVAEE